MRKVHFIGICGVGMSAVAKLLKESGMDVTGSDEGCHPPVSNLLESAGIVYENTYAPGHIPEDVDTIVIGKNANLIPEKNAEVRAAHTRTVPIVSFPEILAGLSLHTQNIIVAGSYGKSTCTALLAHCLIEAGLDPSFFIGAAPLSPNSNAHLGTGSFFVMEGDEYPSSNTDARSKFLHFSPAHLLIAPLAHDHINVFKTPEEYLAPFTQLVETLPEKGSLVVSVSGTLSKQFLNGLNRHVTLYGVHEGAWHTQNIVFGAGMTFTLMNEDGAVCDIETELLGEHNAENIVGVAALLLSRNIITTEQFVSAIKSFRGIRRRLDRKSTKTSIPIYEGFGSSLDKSRSAIAAIKLHFPGRRLLVLFEPHTFSWRNREALPWYDSVFAGVDKVFIYKPPTHGEDTHAQITLQDILSRVGSAGVDATGFEDATSGLEKMSGELRPNDVVLILTSGNLGGLIETLPQRAEELFPA